MSDTVGRVSASIEAARRRHRLEKRLEIHKFALGALIVVAAMAVPLILLFHAEKHFGGEREDGDEVFAPARPVVIEIEPGVRCAFTAEIHRPIGCWKEGSK